MVVVAAMDVVVTAGTVVVVDGVLAIVVAVVSLGGQSSIDCVDGALNDNTLTTKYRCHSLRECNYRYETSTRRRF